MRNSKNHQTSPAIYLIILAFTLTLVSLWVTTTQLLVIATALVLLLAVALDRRLLVWGSTLRQRFSISLFGKRIEDDQD